eukprot:394942-Prymnesium_polylepis.2
MNSVGGRTGCGRWGSVCDTCDSAGRDTRAPDRSAAAPPPGCARARGDTRRVPRHMRRAARLRAPSTNTQGTEHRHGIRQGGSLLLRPDSASSMNPNVRRCSLHDTDMIAMWR